MNRSKRGQRVDGNQKEIVDALRGVGASVQILSDIGGGCVDLAVGFRDMNYMIEVKNGNNDLTPDEKEWHTKWRGQKAVVRSIEQALRVIGAVFLPVRKEQAG